MAEEGSHMSDELKLSSPWDVHAKKVWALFQHDGEVDVDYDGDGPKVTVRVSNAVKAEALASLLPTEQTFGNVTLRIEVVPANIDGTDEQVFRWAFDGNPVLSAMDTESLPDGSPITFALFEPEVAQIFADDLGNPYGIQTYTYEQLAADVLDAGNVLITSDIAGATIAAEVG